MFKIKGFVYSLGFTNRKRLFAPQRGGQEEADRLFAPQWGGQEEANRLFAPQRGGQEKQLCYSPRRAANKRFHFIIRPAADYVTIKASDWSVLVV